MIEWGKLHDTMRKTRHRGIRRVAGDFLLNLIAYNLVPHPETPVGLMPTSAGHIIMTAQTERPTQSAQPSASRHTLIPDPLSTANAQVFQQTAKCDSDRGF